jgi:endonuclease/exonuclease/phosphatase family metal-dependent hydrolase
LKITLVVCVSIWADSILSARLAHAAQNVEATAQQPQHVRIASFNTALNREKAGFLASEVRNGNSPAIQRIAEVIQRVRPDVILLNEVDFDQSGATIDGLRKNYLAVGQNGQPPIDFSHVYFAPVNTGVDTGLDLNGDGKLHTPDDAFGFGLFPGQYGMAVLSRFPIQKSVRTFQHFLWRDMPDAMWPLNPDTESDFYSPEIKQVFRLSSKSHWDVPIEIGNHTVHLIAAHPTPPVFDGSEDRNGRRNHDEIRLIADYLRGADYIYDDQKVRGGLAANSSFVVVGDMNADPVDGDSQLGAGRQLTEHPLINASKIPTSAGARQASEKTGQANAKHKGDPAADTGDFNDKSVGNLRLDFVLPSKDLKVVDSGVYWPTDDSPEAPLATASDHHLVWIDIEF